MADENEKPWYKSSLHLGVIVASLTLLVIIIAYILPNPPPPSDFGISIKPMQGAVQQGGVITTAITIKGVHEYEEPVSLSATGQPSGVILAFVPPFGDAKPSYTSSVTITVDSSVPVGDYTIILKGNGANGKEHSCSYTLTVKPSVTPTSTPIITPTPTQSKLSVAITYPSGEAFHKTTVNGTVSRELKEEEYMWIIVDNFDSLGDWWPQEGGPIMPSKRNLTWEGVARIGGGEQDTDKEFEIVVLIVDANLNSKFKDWQRECVEKEDWPSITNETHGKISKGVIEEKIFDRITVVLKEG